MGWGKKKTSNKSCGSDMIWFRNPGIESKERTGKGLGWMQEQDSRAGYIHPLKLFFFFFSQGS
jgi:hypothetical protein